MVYISDVNLQYAFSKLKKYAYLDTSNNYLKKIILIEENKISKDKDYFKKMAKELNEMSQKDLNAFKKNKISYFVYPKNDSISNDDGTIGIKNVNIFIDIPLKLLLVDVLFCFRIYDLYVEKNNGYFFGNLFDYHLNYAKNKLQNKMLFDYYWDNYKKYKNAITKNIKSDMQLKSSTLLKLDFNRCYYDVIFDFKSFIDNNKFDMNDPVFYLTYNLYLEYSKKIFNMRGMDCKDYDGCAILPVGLPSSSVIQNILFSYLDMKIVEKSGVINYSRYVDDMLFLIDKKLNNNSEIAKLFDGIFLYENNRIYLDDGVIPYLKNRLLLNGSKIEINSASSKIKLKEKIDELVKPSMISIYDEEIIDESENCDDVTFLKRIKTRINKLCRYSSVEALVNFLKSTKKTELVCIYQLWPQIFLKLKNNEYLKELKNILIESIGKIIFLNEDGFITSDSFNEINVKLVETLRNEFGIALKVNTYKNHYLIDINMATVIDYLDECDSENNRQNYYYNFPMYINLETIEFYLGLKNEGLSNYKKAIELYYNVNCINVNDDHPILMINDKTITDMDFLTKENVLEYSSIYSLSYSPKSKIKSDNGILISVANVPINLSELVKTDLKSIYPSTYNLYEIIRIIINSKKEGANCVLFPEFCLPFFDSLTIINVCKKYKISIVIGLTHFVVPKTNSAINYTLIYDASIKSVFLKEKNYYPYEERLLLAKNGLLPRKHKPYYIVVNNGQVVYSTMTCYEATNIRDRGFLNDKVNIIYMPVYNKDTSYFSDIIGSMTRDLSCFVVQSNTNQYGDSRITAPANTNNKEVVKIKGGKNSFYVIGQIDLNKLKLKHKELYDIDNEINNLVSSRNKRVDYKKIIDKIDNSKEKNCFKPLSANSDYNIRKKNGVD